ncbi:phage holin family protein [Noviherbaspirillum sedimenti]|uniref:Phage holin family protein n=1 Tax=Noviherbaspirillum sedimenti TaxID=2320865 RepID=A0A3A3GKT7_9BURK|nr:phage holin family protein [Noviherbaspirillum sedimenti]RJG01580.1 phage holin family protein [Noviherbaspirillum sedimenti]
MLNTLRKSRKLYAIALDRLHDYKELLRIELQLQGRGVGVQIAAYMLAGLMAVLAVTFIGIAIIVTAWDTPYRSAAAWLVAALYALLAGICMVFVRKYHAESALTTLKSELQRDYKVLKESL